jgi:hypothetical protein
MSSDEILHFLTTSGSHIPGGLSYQNPAVARILQQQRQQQQQQQQQQTITLIQKNPCTSILEILNASPASMRKDLTYIVTDVKRASHEQSWGLTFSLFDNTLNKIVIGETKAIMKEHMSTSYVMVGNHHVMDLNMIYDQHVPSTNQSRKGFRERLKLYAQSKSHLQPFQRSLILPGDIILAVNGFKPSNFPSLSDFTKYLRGTLQLSLVLLRHPHATAAAMSFYTTVTRQSPNTPFQAASAAYNAWRIALFERHVPLPSSIIRRVTQDEPVLSSAMTASSKSRVGRGVDLHQTQNIQYYLQQLANIPRISNMKSQVSSSSSSPYQLSSNKQTPTSIRFPSAYPDYWKNPFFITDGKAIPYDDNWEYSPDDGYRASLFLPPIDEFQPWLKKRKRTWRNTYKVYKHLNEDNDEENMERGSCNVPIDFWTPQGFESFHGWLQERKGSWRTNYSKYRKKRQRIHKECEEVVHLNGQSIEEFDHWLRIRKNQWKVLRRKRQRQMQEEKPTIPVQSESCPRDPSTSQMSTQPTIVTPEKATTQKVMPPKPSLKDIDMACIDEILRDEEQQRKKMAERPPIDISFLFFSSKGAPDDVVVHCFGYLERKEHGKLLCVSKGTSDALKNRDFLWQQLCPSHWILRELSNQPYQLVISQPMNSSTTSVSLTQLDDLVNHGMKSTSPSYTESNETAKRDGTIYYSSAR